MTVRTDNVNEVGVHVFQKAGLGLAPFRCVGVVSKVGPMVMGNVTVGSAGQAMGTCDYCGTGIKDCYVIRSSDGKQFEVGCDCVAKTGDAGLIKSYKNLPAVRAFNKAKRLSLDAKKSTEIAELLRDNAAFLKTLSMTKWNGQTETQFDYITRVLPMCGAAGRARFLKHIKSLLTVK